MMLQPVLPSTINGIVVKYPTRCKKCGWFGYRAKWNASKLPCPKCGQVTEMWLKERFCYNMEDGSLLLEPESDRVWMASS